MRLTLRGLAVVAFLFSMSTPVAAEVHTEPSRSPELAAGLAVGTPIGLMALSRFSPDPLLSVAVPALGLGVGHVYAGRPVRGAVVAVGSAMAGAGVFNLLRPADASAGVAFPVVVMLGAAVALSLAAHDAYVTTEKANAAGPIDVVADWSNIACTPVTWPLNPQMQRSAA